MYSKEIIANKKVLNKLLLFLSNEYNISGIDYKNNTFVLVKKIKEKVCVIKFDNNKLIFLFEKEDFLSVIQSFILNKKGAFIQLFLNDKNKLHILLKDPLEVIKINDSNEFNFWNIHEEWKVKRNSVYKKRDTNLPYHLTVEEYTKDIVNKLPIIGARTAEMNIIPTGKQSRQRKMNKADFENQLKESKKNQEEYDLKIKEYEQIVIDNIKNGNIDEDFYNFIHRRHFEKSYNQILMEINNYQSIQLSLF